MRECPNLTRMIIRLMLSCLQAAEPTPCPNFLRASPGEPRFANGALCLCARHGHRLGGAPRCLKDVIEEELFARRRNLFSKLDLVFMDTTSLYFEGAGGQTLGQRGFSKDPCLSGCHPQPLAVVFGHAHGRSPAWQSSVPTIAPRVPATFSRRRGLRRLPGEGSLERRVCLPPLSGGGRAVPLRKSSWRLALPQVPP